MNIKPAQPSQIPTIIRTPHQRVKFDIPTTWSINKLKCLLLTQVQNLKFDYFQLMHSGKLVHGDTKIGSICSIGERELDLVVVNAKSQISFEQYYGRNMGQFLELANSSHLPILSIHYQHALNLIENQKQKQLDQQADAAVNEAIQRQLNQEAQQLPQLLKILRVLGLSIFLSVVISHGNLYQISILLFIILSHYAIDLYRAYYGKKVKQNNQQNETEAKAAKSEDNDAEIGKLGKIKGEFYFRYYKFLQVVLCFFLTLYPNWDIQLHRHIHEVRIAQWKQKVNQLRPGTYELKKQKAH